MNSSRRSWSQETKSGVSETKFYKRLIEKADKRYKEHLDNL
jgi:hypothetical protein